MLTLVCPCRQPEEGRLGINVIISSSSSLYQTYCLAVALFNLKACELVLLSSWTVHKEKFSRCPTWFWWLGWGRTCLQWEWDSSRVARNEQLMDRQVFNKCFEFDQADPLVLGHVLFLWWTHSWSSPFWFLPENLNIFIATSWSSSESLNQSQCLTYIFYSLFTLN